MMGGESALNPSQREIFAECEAIRDLLLTKNRRYGDSALDPVRIFSRADLIEQINVRLDDKLSRLRSDQVDEDEDVDLDLIGYLVLRRIARRRMRGTGSLIDVITIRDVDLHNNVLIPEGSVIQGAVEIDGEYHGTWCSAMGSYSVVIDTADCVAYVSGMQAEERGNG